MKKALITGITGMDGSYLADLLLTKGYEVYGMERRASTKNRTNTAHLEGKVNFLMGDLTDQNSIVRCIEESQPDEIYNLAAMSHVRISFDMPSFTIQTNALGVLNMLEVYRTLCPDAKYYQANVRNVW